MIFSGFFDEQEVQNDSIYLTWIFEMYIFTDKFNQLNAFLLNK